MTDEQLRAYDDATEITSDPLGIIGRDNRNHEKKQTIILNTTTARPGDRVLEVGCGHGLHATRYAQHYDYTGIDLSHSLTHETQAKLQDTEETRVLQMDATQLSFGDNTFEAVVGTAILHHLPDVHEALQEWSRVTKPGGSITLMEPNYLFPLAFATTHTIPEERHKRQMAPWRLTETLNSLGVASASVEPRLYTPPIRSPLADAIDRVGSRVPGLRWVGQMLLLDIRV